MIATEDGPTTIPASGSSWTSAKTGGVGNSSRNCPEKFREGASTVSAVVYKVSGLVEARSTELETAGSAGEGSSTLSSVAVASGRSS